ncbi:hypothetical protein [Halorarius halobius]|uniref:hypothetical protein n=1 Tax=Halorarius halobius TaxID=2962671 RepID=UPI0020CC4A50|nr:hypothetical protein [Halorarius halobius]
MDVRDAVEADAERMAELTGSPADVMRNLVHDRTVRIAEAGEETRGFVSFDAQRETVHVTQLEGTHDACERLLEEPVRFAEREGMAVELLVAEDDDLRAVAHEAGFTEHGEGPRFEGTRTVRYRLDA